MTILDSFTNAEIIGIFTLILGSITVIALLCGAFYKLGKLHSRIDTIEENVTNLPQETRGLTALQRDVDRLLNRTEALSVRIEQHRLSVEALQESERIREGSKGEH
jgi:hypothetical protein